MLDPADYYWTEDLGPAACVTLVAGSTVEEVLERFGADASIILEGEDAYGGGSKYPASVAAVDVPGGVVAVEDNGYEGSRPEVLARLSAGGSAASMFWNVNDDNAFSCARDGRLVATVDMYDAEDPDGVDLPDELTELFARAGDDETDMWAVGLAMAAEFTGVRVSRESMRNLAVHPVRHR
ncbi:DUF6461 domain-containing protein [Nocardioides sp. MH1]|uniref:DUF6461 domain-containing protein n=1 Tax=Nocardioides sp. MH1 TaxID=3242490 RepID=UPI003520FC80